MIVVFCIFGVLLIVGIFLAFPTILKALGYLILASIGLWLLGLLAMLVVGIIIHFTG